MFVLCIICCVLTANMHSRIGKRNSIRTREELTILEDNLTRVREEVEILQQQLAMAILAAERSEIRYNLARRKQAEQKDCE